MHAPVWELLHKSKTLMDDHIASLGSPCLWGLMDSAVRVSTKLFSSSTAGSLLSPLSGELRITLRFQTPQTSLCFLWRWLMRGAFSVRSSSAENVPVSASFCSLEGFFAGQKPHQRIALTFSVTIYSFTKYSENGIIIYNDSFLECHDIFVAFLLHKTMFRYWKY